MRGPGAHRPRKSSGGSQPSGMAAHDFHDGYRIRVIHIAVSNNLQHGSGNKFGRRTESRGMVSAGQVIIDGFWNADDLYILAGSAEVAGQFVHSIHRIIAADVKKVGNLVMMENFIYFFIERRIRIFFRQTEPAGSQCHCGGAFQDREVLLPGKLGAKVDDCTGQYALNPIERTVYAIEFLAADGFLDRPGQRCVNGGSWPARLRDQHIVHIKNPPGLSRILHNFTV